MRKILKIILRIILSFLISFFLVMFLWDTTNSYRDVLCGFMVDVKHALIVGFFFVLIDAILLNKMKKYKIWFRIGSFILIFILTVIIDFSISYNAVLGPFNEACKGEYPGLKYPLR